MQRQEALNRGLLPDDSTLKQLALEESSIVYGKDLEYMQWPDLELRAVLIRKLISQDSFTSLASMSICSRQNCNVAMFEAD